MEGIANRPEPLGEAVRRGAQLLLPVWVRRRGMQRAWETVMLGEDLRPEVSDFPGKSARSARGM